MDFNLIALAFLASLCVGGLAYVFIYPSLSGEKRAEERQKALMMTQAVERATGRTAGSRREQVAQSLKEVDERAKKRAHVTLERRVAQAGLSISKGRFLTYVVGAGVLLSFLAFALTQKWYVAAGLFFVIVFGFPRWFLSFLVKRRINKFIEEFPNAMDVIVRGVKAGLPLGDCLRIIANESAEPVKSEFRYIVESQTMGISLTEAAEKLYERVPIAEANFFGIVLMIQQKAGGNLAEALGNLSKVLRERKKMKGKIKAMSSEAKASAGIIASLPVIVAVILQLTSPKYIELLYTTNYGQVALAICAFWMFCGVTVMRKMINFDF